jgi:hypothetical protein
MRLAAACVALGVIAGMHASGVHAQARGASVQDIEARMDLDPEPTHETRMSDLDTWLRRLVGRFVVMDDGTPVTRMDCTSVGSGPGVRCVSRAVGPRVNRDTPGPAFTLYGIDPDLPGIRILKVSGLSIADHDEAGKLRGNKVIFASACPLPPHVPPQGPRKPPTPFSCWHQTTIFAPPDGGSVLFRVNTQIGIILPPPDRPPGGGTSPSYNRTQTFSGGGGYEWLRLADDEVSEPVLQLESMELDSLEQYRKAEVPELAGHVVDQAGSLAPAQLAELEAQLAAYETRTSHRIIVVTVGKLGALSIEAFSSQAAAIWQLGSEERSDYILVAVAPNDGSARIEPGADMLDCVPDDMAEQILEEVMIPEFRYQRTGEGIRKGVASLMAACRDLPAAKVEQ